MLGRKEENKLTGDDQYIENFKIISFTTSWLVFERMGIVFV